ncbi:MAG: SAM-dependent methyltransferase, partial [Deltaproteobacteria bacterium]
MSGRLSVVATPIGCLEDITLRALRILREADVILAEDTRHTRTLCSKHGIDTPLRSFHAHTNDDKVNRIVADLLNGAHYALV